MGEPKKVGPDRLELLQITSNGKGAMVFLYRYAPKEGNHSRVHVQTGQDDEEDTESNHPDAKSEVL